MIDNFNKLKDLMVDTETDLKKFSNRYNKSAGVRARTNLTKIIKLATEIRKEVLDTRKKIERTGE